MKVMAVAVVSAILAGSPALAAPTGDQSFEFEIARAKGTLHNPWTGSSDPVELRSFVGSGAAEGDFVAPTIRIAPGRTLTIDLDNKLEPCTQEQIAKHRCFNETNLHTHGLWVSPSGNSDNVLISIPPGEKFRYEYEISNDHPAGTFWYHPHRHGAGYVQVGSGMAGALIVTGDRKPTADRPGDIDILLKDENGRAFPERVMLFQQIQYGCLDEKGEIEGTKKKEKFPSGGEAEVYVRPWTCAAGRVGRVESDDNDWDWQWSGRFTGINGKVQPRLETARAGRFERWRMIHAGTREPVRVQLRALAANAPDLHEVKGADQEKWIADHCTGEPLPMWQVAMDGLARSNVRQVTSAVLFSGDRMDVIARFPAAGRYCMIHDARRLSNRPLPVRALTVIEAIGSAPGSAELDGEAMLTASLVQAAQLSLSGAGEVRDRV
ncbi:MAG TPA: multicopper oxidase domain-containing protein, partial [Sphingomicrobium sp.]|nr:multicopper oxidase domain-containing protein [Sphingomicrobium sp.]